jgi:T5orf172 domain
MDDTAGHIYFLTDGTGLYKIGHTKWGRLEQRLRELNGKQAARPIKQLWSIDVCDRIAAEKDLHKTFAAQRWHGEWFKFSNHELKAVRSAYNAVERGYSVKSFGLFRRKQPIKQVDPEPLSDRSQNGLFDIPIPILIGGIALLFIGVVVIHSDGDRSIFSSASPRTISLFCSSQQAPIHIRSDASRESQVVIDAPCGTKMEAIGIEGAWTQVRWHQVSGFVSSELIVDP